MPTTLAKPCTVIALTLITAVSARAADITVQPAANSGFVVKNATGGSENLRVQESGAITLASVPGASPQSTGLCMSGAGLLGPCSSGSGSGPAYTAATGLSLSGTTFSVAPTYQLPQGCSSNQIPQWNGSAWACASASGATLPAGTVNQTLRYDASNAPVANSELQVFADGGVLATDAAVNTALQNNLGQPGPGSIPAVGQGARLMWYPAKGAFRAGYVRGTQWDDASIGLYSAAMNYSTTASGFVSTAMGVGTRAVGDYSSAMGENTAASAEASIAMGGATAASGRFSTAIGLNTTASNFASTAMGDATTASGQYSTSMGNATTAGGDSSTAMGSGTSATGPNSLAIGSNTTASGTNAFAMGSGSQALGTNAVALGINATAGYDNSFVWNGDASYGTVNSVNPGEFVVRSSSDITLSATPNLCALTSGSAGWNCASDRNLKTSIHPADTRAVLDRLLAMPIADWVFKGAPQYAHLGPMAQDFKAAFSLGDSDKSIGTTDAQGVAFAAIQGLDAKLEERIGTLKRQFAAWQGDKDKQIAELQNMLAAQQLQLAVQRDELTTQRERIASLQTQGGEIAALKSAVNALQRGQMESRLTTASVQP